MKFKNIEFGGSENLTLRPDFKHFEFKD